MRLGPTSNSWSKPLSIGFALACTACPDEGVRAVTQGEVESGTSSAATDGGTFEPDSSASADETTTTTASATTDATLTTSPTETTDATLTETTTEASTETTTNASTETTTDASSTLTSTGGPTCGDGVAEGAEACDGNDLAGEDCGSQGFTGGVLQCNDDCTFDTNGCSSATCGNDVVEGVEECDGTDLAGQTCQSEGFSLGNLACAADCTLDTSGCSNPMCGNDALEMGEICDGADLGGETCLTQGLPNGLLTCLGDCSGFDTSGCTCVEEDIGGAMGPAVTSGNTAGEDNDIDAGCGGAGGNDHIVQFTAPFAGTFVFDTFGAGYDTKIALYSDCATQVACNDDAGGTLQSSLQVDLAAGQTILVVIDGFNGSTGNWVLNIGQPPVCGDGVAAGSEACDGADLVGEDCTSFGFVSGVLACAPDCTGYDTSGCSFLPVCVDADIGGTTGASVSSGNTGLDDDDLSPSCGGAGGNDHVMQFTAGAAGTYTFDTFGSGYDTKLALFSDCATELGCNDDAVGLQSSLQLNMAAGQTVFIVVDGFGGATGAWVLNITPPAAAFPCEDQDLGSVIGNGVAAGSTVGDDNDIDAGCGGAGGNDHVMRWAAPNAASFTFNTFGSGYDTKLALFSDCATQLVCNDDTGGLQSQVQRNMANGEVVLIVVDGFNGATGNWTLNITSP